MDHGAQESARLRAAIRVGMADRPRRGIALGRAPVLEPGDAIAQRGHAEAEHAGAHSRVGELIDASLLEAALEIHVAGVGDDAPAFHAGEAPAVPCDDLDGPVDVPHFLISARALPPHPAGEANAAAAREGRRARCEMRKCGTSTGAWSCT